MCAHVIWIKKKSSEQEMHNNNNNNSGTPLTNNIIFGGKCSFQHKVLQYRLPDLLLPMLHIWEDCWSRWRWLLPAWLDLHDSIQLPCSNARQRENSSTEGPQSEAIAKWHKIIIIMTLNFDILAYQKNLPPKPINYQYWILLRVIMINFTSAVL